MPGIAEAGAVLVYNDQTANDQGEVAALVAGYAATQISRGRASRRG